MAAPTGGQVTAGSGTISQNGTTTTITQSSQNLSLNWQSFNTSSNEIVNFVQPSASAIAVNRISDTNATQFFGKLNANGQVYLINPNGVLFGAGSQINVGGLVASTLDISDASLSNAMRNFSGAGTGSIINQGNITTSNGGYVAFIGNSVSNQGTISTPAGATALAAGSDVTLSFSGDSLVKLQINQSTLNNLAENGGLIKSDGGAVWMSAGAKDAVLASVVNNTGIIEARSVQNIDGVIVLEAGSAGTATNSGTLAAAGVNNGETGGTVKVLGGTVKLAAGSVIDVSGDAGGGTALVGGNFLGAGSEQNAHATTVEAGAAINADAITSGNGGNVAVWSDGTTQFNGSITARGGSTSGNGGQVETSGKKLNIKASASVSTAASHGTSGNWLLDPDDIVIGNVSLWDSATAATINVDSLVLTKALNNGNVTIKTTASSASCSGVAACTGSSGNGDIVVLDVIGAGNDYSINGTPNVNWNTGSYTLTLSAYHNIRFKYSPNANTVAGTSNQGGGIAIDTNSGHIVLRADNTGTGSGTVVFDALDNFISLNNASSTVKIYYNAASYTSPTDYEQNLWANTNQLTAYMAINVTGSVANKTYDGNDIGVLSGLDTLAGNMPGGLTLKYLNSQVRFSDKNAGDNKAVSITGVTFANDDTTIQNGGNYYYLNGLDSKTATINKANLTLSGTKTYDGTQTVAGSTLTAIGVNGETFTVTGSGDATNLNSKNVQASSTLNSVTGLGLGSSSNGGLSDNYNVLSTTGSTYTVTAKGITLSGITASDKIYDATTAAMLNTSGVTFGGLISGDTVGLAGTGTGTFDGKGVGTNKTVTVSGYTLSGGDAGNYALTQPTGLTASISKADLVVSGISASDKTYDATSSATLSGTASVTGLLSDIVSVVGTGAGSFNGPDAGTNKTVTVTGYTLSGQDANNYNVVQPTGLTATINKADLTLSGSKVYDGTNSVAGSTLTATGVGGQTFTVTGSGDASNLASKNVLDNNNAQLSSINGLSLGASSNGGLSSNYNVLSTSGSSYTVTAKGITLSGITAADKVYDATTTATLNTSNVSYSGIISGDTIFLGGSGVGSFDTKDVGVNKTVSVSGYTLGGTDAGNYVVTQPSGLTASVSKADLALTGLSTSDKVYDSTTAAVLTGTASLAAAIGNDVISLGGTGIANFTDKNVGNNKSVTVSGYTLSGTDANNYNIVDQNGLSANITPATIVVSGISASDKVYDGNVAAVVNATNAVLAGKLGNDVITIASTGNFSDAGVGNGKTVLLSSTYGGADAGNYVFNNQATTLADITPAPVVAPTAPSQQVQNTITQVQSSILPPQASAQPMVLNLSSTLQVQNSNSDGSSTSSTPNSSGLINTSSGFGTPAPTLQIQNGGMQLPLVATTLFE